MKSIESGFIIDCGSWTTTFKITTSGKSFRRWYCVFNISNLKWGIYKRKQFREMCLYIEGLETIIKTFLKCSWEEYSLIIDSPQQQNKESKFKSIKSCYISLRVCTSFWKWFGVGILMNLKLKYVYRVIKSHCTITRLAKCILKNQKYLLFFYTTWNTVSGIAFLLLSRVINCDGTVTYS